MKLKNKVALVTGSSRGIGKAIALTFAKEGANVVINYVKNMQMAEEVVNQIKAFGQHSLAIRADVSDDKQVENMVQEIIDKFGKIDILVNNTGIIRDNTIRKMTKEQWDEVISVNLTSVFNCTKAAINYMREQESGRIINIISVQAQTGVIGASNYAASKSGIVGFTKSAAREVARKNITVNAVALGFFKTGLLYELSEELRESILQKIPMARFGELEEIAKTILFLASDDSSYITGQVININGGYYM